MKTLNLFFRFTFILISTTVTHAQNVELPTPDSTGWIKLFRGDNHSDFYTFYRSGQRPAQAKESFPDNTFTSQGDTIMVSGSPTGHLMFNQSFSHYKARFEMRFPGSLGNCGLLLHVQENDPPAGVFPRSIESQGDPNQGFGQVWCIGDVWITVRANTGGNQPQYNPNADEITYGGANWNSRLITGIDGYGQPRPSELSNGGWISMEVEVHGSDSIAHKIMGDTVISYRNPVVSSGGTANNVSKVLESGLLAWQSEGRAVWYRNLEIQLFPEDPLYEELYVVGIDPKKISIKTNPYTSVLIMEDGSLRFRIDESKKTTFVNVLGQHSELSIFPTLP